MSEPMAYDSGKRLLASGVLKDMPVKVMLTHGYEPVSSHKMQDVSGELACDGYERKTLANIRLVDSADEFSIHGDDVNWEHLPAHADGAVLYVPDADDALLCYCPIGKHKRPLTIRWPNGILGL